ncbi:MAG: hypothetical protein CML86_06130, partial [Rhodobiaceae bacterium]|nr:hypothetical protein [Rhodobiaceae bacterium]
MIFNFNEKKCDNVLGTSRIFHLPPHNDFARLFVDGLLSKFEKQALKLNPEFLGQVIILASNKRLAQGIEESLESYNFSILPKVFDLRNLREIFYEIYGKNPIEAGVLNKYEPISNLEKFLVLNRVIQQIQKEGLEASTNVTSFDLA